MSRENVELVRRFQESMELARSSVEDPYREVLELLDPEIVIRVAASLPHGGEWVGHAGFLAMEKAIVGARRVIGEAMFTYLDAGEDHVVVLIEFMHEVHHSAQVARIRMVEIITVRNGRIATLDPYYEDTVPFARASGATL
jgi:hypothetical protein